jgi:thioredoxin reductase (NADPH)
VLVVDDDPQVLGAHVRALRSTCVAVAATSASEALSMLEQSRFDVLLTDHDMPGDSCETLLAAAKRLSPDMRRVVVSAADEGVLAQAVHRGLAHEYLCKPASAQMLHELVCVV